MKTPEQYSYELFQIAIDADEAVEIALEKHFGKGVNRFDYPKSEWDQRSIDAMDEKLRADECFYCARKMLSLCQQNNKTE